MGFGFVWELIYMCCIYYLLQYMDLKLTIDCSNVSETPREKTKDWNPTLRKTPHSGLKLGQVVQDPLSYYETRSRKAAARLQDAAAAAAAEIARCPVSGLERDRVVLLFARSHLPKDGWLQACVFCQEITGNIHSVSKTDVSSLIKRSWSLMFPRWRTCVFISFRCAQCCSRLRRRPSLKKQYLHCVRAAIDKHFRARLRS